MPELMSSLPVAGVDGTLSRSKGTPGRAHLKTGSLRDVVGIAGYVLADSGRRYVVVAIVNHANANGARPALDAIAEWVASDAPAPSPGASPGPP
jgi:D-alanyl-D-alanine carboxypeptidase/D-alanyl-D-alanine-endopeptidase (penicillin-binding protein 4)